MKITRAILGALLVSTLGVAACSDDDNKSNTDGSANHDGSANKDGSTDGMTDGGPPAGSFEAYVINLIDNDTTATAAPDDVATNAANLTDTMDQADFSKYF